MVDTHTHDLGYTVVSASHAQIAEDPQLDDESKLAQMEARESREIGADRKNTETFGKSASEGWSYEEAVKANAKLSSSPAFGPMPRWKQDRSHLSPETAATTIGGESSENDATDSCAGEWEDPWAMAAHTYSDYSWYYNAQMHPDFMLPESYTETWTCACPVSVPPGLDGLAPGSWAVEDWAAAWEETY